MLPQAVEVETVYTERDHALREYDRYARAKYDLTLRWLRPFLTKDTLLYNVGAGGGYFNHLAAERSRAVVGCEPDPVAFARATGNPMPSNCELLQLDLQTFSQNRAPADAVVMHDVLEHIADDKAAAEDLRSLVREGGRVVVSVPALGMLFGQHDIDLGHYRRYSMRSLRQVLEPHFKIKRLRYFGMASIPIVLCYSVLRKAAYPKVAASENLISRIYGAVCSLEARIPEPLGTSLIAELEPRS